MALLCYIQITRLYLNQKALYRDMYAATLTLFYFFKNKNFVK